MTAKKRIAPPPISWPASSRTMTALSQQAKIARHAPPPISWPGPRSPGTAAAAQAKGNRPKVLLPSISAPVPASSHRQQRMASLTREIARPVVRDAGMVRATPTTSTCAQPFFSTLLIAGTIASAYYFRDRIFEKISSKPIIVKDRDQKNISNEINKTFEEYDGLSIRFTTKSIISCSVKSILTISYDTSNFTLGIGHIARPKNVPFYASDIVFFVISRLEEFIKKSNKEGEFDQCLTGGRLSIKRINGAAIVNTATQKITTFPGVKLISKYTGRLGTAAASWTPLGKMVNHLLAEHYPDLEMKNISLVKGSKSDAHNAAIELGATSN
jgi:hypothetical protein